MASLLHRAAITRRIGATWRKRLNRPCAAAMRPFCQITLATCFYVWARCLRVTTVIFSTVWSPISILRYIIRRPSGVVIWRLTDRCDVTLMLLVTDWRPTHQHLPVTSNSSNHVARSTRRAPPHDGCTDDWRNCQFAVSLEIPHSRSRRAL